MKYHRIKSLSMAIMLLCSCSLLAGSLQSTNQWGGIDWAKRIVFAVGIGAPSPNMPIAAARPAALRAAQMTALRNALEIVKGIPLDATTTVENRMVSNDVITTKIDGFLQGFQEQGKPKYMSDGTVELTMEIPLDGDLASSLLPESVTDTSSVKKGLKETKKKPSFTGLIVDCTRLGLKPAMLPAVIDEANKQIFGVTTIARSSAVKWGAAAYVNTVDEAKLLVDRIGAKPLIVKALKAVGRGNADAMISKKDGEQITGNTANVSLLEECRVVFVVE
jgi:hypothetical protein